MGTGEVDTQAMQQAVSEQAGNLNLEPLDPARVEEVVGEYAKTHVCHKHGALIFVGSGGGKSTTCRREEEACQKTGKQPEFVDADLVYRETGAHPCQPGVFPLRPIPWWDMGEGVIHEVDRRCGMVNAALVEHGLWALTTSFSPNDEYLPEAIVILPWKEHRRRIIEKAGGGHYDGGAKATDEGFALVLRHRRWVKGVAEEKGIPIVDSIDAAINLVRSREAGSS